jgi:3-hydroxyisobutyrate dehydrogenase-like beta-hydroxyacid dehydrogenase
LTAIKPVIGIVGLGQIGMPIAKNLIAHDFAVVGYRRTHTHELAEAGGIPQPNPAAVCRTCEILLLCLPNEEVELEVLTEVDGILSALRMGQIVIDLGTSRKEFKQHVASLIEGHGGRYLEVEVSGSPPMVMQHRAALYIGGDSELHAASKPVLDAISPFQFHLGDLGSAVTMKLIANYLLTIHTLAAAEAMNLGTRAGFDPRVVAEVIAQGAGGSTMFSIRAPLMAERKFSPAPGPFVTLEKYLQMGSQLSSDLGCASPLFTAALPYFRSALKQGMGEEDISAVIKLLEAESQPSTKKRNERDY